MGTAQRSARGMVAVTAALALVMAGCGDVTGDPNTDGTGSPTGAPTEGTPTGGTASPCVTGEELPGPPGEPPVDGATAISVTTVEYAFHGIDANMAAGPYAFTLDNQGDEVHEMVVLRLADGVTFDDVMEMDDEEADQAVEFAGGAIACPGDEAPAFGVELASGSYAVVCFLPVGATAEADLETLEGEPHAVRGMVVELTVSG